MALPVLVLSLALLAIFYALDSYFFKKEAQAGALPEIDRSKDKPIKLHGKRNLFLLAGIVGAVLMSGVWKPGVVFDIMGTPVELQNIVRD
ncbi:sodium:proton antiporter, partial [Enterococcus lactis]|uniref:sodium:proton antiporter n=2 Tax=Bacteria TaxID=2 RepID=UPI0034E97E4C